MRPSTRNEEAYLQQRLRMVERQIRGRGIRDLQVLEAMEGIPRHLFVPRSLAAEAYEDFPLPIGEGQTISQPYIVALMTEALALTGGERVLEIGTGSGYQTAILAGLARTVVSIERSERLSDAARTVLDRLGITNATLVVGDGTRGHAESAPFERILATGSLPRVPETLLDQLTPSGILVLPVGSRHAQELRRIESHDGVYREEDLGACRFVPLIGESGWPS